MNKQVVYTFKGSNRDISHTKHDFNYYFEGQHIKLIATDSKSTGSLTNEKGNERVLTIPEITINTNPRQIVYGNSILDYIDVNNELSNVPNFSDSQIIIGHTTTRDGIILITTDDLGMDCIWEVTDIFSNDYELRLLYVRNLELSSSNPVQILFNYENENIQKIYWVDGKNQIRFLNIRHSNIEGNSNIIEIPQDTINFVGDINFSQPIIGNIISGGLHTAGMIQYVYNLYRLNGIETTISPPSKLIPLNKGDGYGGGDINEIVGRTVEVKINNIDNKYTHIKVYAIKYTSFGEEPSVNLIEERELNNDSSITVYDDGNTLSSLSLSELVFLGSEPTIPKHIESKDSRLFLSNLKDTFFVIPKELDCRAYSFPENSSTTKVWENIQLNNDGEIDLSVNWTPIDGTFTLNKKHDAINLDYDTNRYQISSSIQGGSGKFIEYELYQHNISNESFRYFKDREIYRIGIIFYNKLGQESFPEWIADFKAPSGNLLGNKNGLKIRLTSEFFTWLNTYNFESENDIPVGYKIVRAKRNFSDRTILCQGILSTMIVQSTTNPTGPDENNTNEHYENRSKELILTPTPNIRTFETPPITGHFPGTCLRDIGICQHLKSLYIHAAAQEIYYGSTGSKRRQNSWQYTRMFQLHSPDVLFNDGIFFNRNTKLNIIGTSKRYLSHGWMKVIKVDTRQEDINLKAYTSNNVSGIIMPTPFAADRAEFKEIYRSFYNTEFATNPSNCIFDIYGKPEITERGAPPKSYNGESALTYRNNLKPIITDREDEDDERAILSVNTFSTKCVTIVEGEDDIDIEDRKTLESICNITGSSKDGVLLAELIIPKKLIYLGNIYGGNTYEEKLRTEYIDIGEYYLIPSTYSSIYKTLPNCGDTFVQRYNFSRMHLAGAPIYDDRNYNFSEKVSFICETSIDLNNRSDDSIQAWDSSFQPQYEEYHKYNRVYSQESDFLKRQPIDFNFKRIKNFDTRIQATSLKIPNETIDSWTNTLTNEVMDLDGKYGSINNIITFNDEMYSFQDKAISNIAINPRIQVQGSDGVSIDLGTGGILHDYTYLTTTSGSINKWAIKSTKRGIYYFDALNKALGRVPDATKLFLSDIKGQHTLFNNNFNFSDIEVDNPILKQGVNIGYDSYNNDLFLTLHQNDASFTLCFNELIEEFIDNKTYLPSGYINLGEKFLTYNPDNNMLYEQYAGEYNKFFEEYQDSYIILQLNPASNLTAIFDNIEFNSELYLNDIDQPDKTLTHIQAYNEYQDSGVIPLILGRGSNLRRKFRRWRANIPRDGRNRIRNPWVFLKLSLSNEDNYKLILHDIIVDFTV